MTDVVKIAKDHLDALEDQIGRLEEFIRVAEELLKQSHLKPDMASATDDEMATDSTGATNATLNSSATTGNDPEAEREDLPIRELNTGEQMGESHDTHNEPPKLRFPSLGRLHP